MTLGVAILAALTTCVAAGCLVAGVVASARSRLCPAAADIRADGASYRLEIGLDVCCSAVGPLPASRSSLTTASGSTLSLVGSVGEAALSSRAAELAIPSAQLTAALASLEKLTVRHAGLERWESESKRRSEQYCW